MVRHLVILKWKEGVDDAHVAATVARLQGLASVIPEIRSYACGADLGLAPTNGHFGIAAGFDDVDGYLAYRDHPEHQEVLRTMIVPFVDERVAVQLDDA